MSAVGEIYKAIPYRAPFRELTGRLQLCDGDIARTLERYYADKIVSPLDRELFLARAERAWNWLQDYAPDEFRYQIHRQPVAVDLSPKQQEAIQAFRQLLGQVDLQAIEAKDLNQRLYDDIIHTTGCDGKEFFAAVYQKLIGRDQGPRLPGFIKELGRDRILSLLQDA